MTNSERSETIGAWSGSRADLQRLLDLIEDILKPVRQERYETVVERAEKRAERSEKWAQTARDWLDANPIGTQTLDPDHRERQEKALIDYEIMAEEQRVTAEMEAHRFKLGWGTRLVIEDKFGRDVETAYDAAGLARRVDPRTVKTIAIQAPTSGSEGAYLYDISVQNEYKGVRLTVSSPEQVYTQSAIGRLSEELRRGRPWWYWLTNELRTTAIAGIILTAALVIAFGGKPGFEGVGTAVGLFDS